MRVIEFTETGGPDVLKIGMRSKPVPKAGQVLIRVLAAGVNRPDILQRQGHYAPPADASDVLGLEIAGVIDQIGPGVDEWARNDHVCALVHGGGYAEYCIADQRTVLPIPQGLTYVEAASLPEAFFTVWYNVFERGGLEAGESFLIHGGSSGIGTAAIQLAKCFGAKVITTVGSSDKADYCRSLGAELVINYRTSNFRDVILSATEGRGVDLVLDMVGGDYLAKNLDCLGENGRHVSIAFSRGQKAELNIAKIMQKQLTLSGSTLRPRTAEEKGMIAESLLLFVWPLIDLGQINPHIFKAFPLSGAADAHRLMEQGYHKGKIVLKTEF